MSKKNNKNEVAVVETKNEAVVVVDDSMATWFADLDTALAAKITDYIAREDSCAAAMTKIWFADGLTESESIEFCKKWMAEHKPKCSWGSKKSDIKAHRNWLRKMYWMRTETNNLGKIQVVGTVV